MKKIYWLGLLPSLVMAHESEKNYGYSYFTFGLENVTYQEHYSNLSSDVTIMNPVLNSGGLYYINDTFDFSIDALASFSPLSDTESWQNNGVLSQTNQLEYLKTATNIQLHYKLDEAWRVIGGPALTYQTYTRYGMKNHNGFVNKAFYGTGMKPQPTSLLTLVSLMIMERYLMIINGKSADEPCLVYLFTA